MTAPAEAQRCEAAEPERRVGGFDRLRGLAVALMVLDHTMGVWAPAGGLGVRLTLGRAAMPLFCLVAGALYRGAPPSRRRLVQLLVASVAAAWALDRLGLGGPLFLLAFVVVRTWVLPLLRDTWWLPALVLVQLAQPHVLGLDLAGLAGYQVGAMALLMLLGSWWGPRLASAGDRLPAVLGRLGRYPLALYCGHLLLFVGLR